MPSVWRGDPAGAFGLGDRVDDRGQAAGGERGAAEVEAAPARLLGVGRHDLAGAVGERGGDGQVDEEDQPPVDELGEHAAEEDAERGAGAADGAPGGERLRAGRPVEGAGDDRERGGREHRGAEALAGAGGEQRGRRAGHRRGEGRGGEDAEAGEEHAAAAEQVGGAAAEQEQAAEDERVGRDRPADRRAGDVAGRGRGSASRCSRR